MLVDLIDAVIAELGTTRTDTSCFIGPEYLRHEHSPPRVVFVPTSGSIDPTMRIGETVEMATVNGAGRSLHTRKSGCDVHVWGDPADNDGDGYRATEELMHDVLRALHRKGVGQRLCSDEEWNDETLDIKYGRELIFRFVAYIPVSARPSNATSNSPPGDTKANIMTTLQTAGGDSTGCSGTGE